MRIGLIGTGRIGTFHAEVLSRHPAVDALLLADAAPERAAAAAARTGATAVPVDGLFGGEGAAGGPPDAVVICSATSAHAGLIARAARAGLPVFCEKPIALDLSGTLAALAEVEAAGSVLQLGFMRRFDAGYGEARAAVREEARPAAHRAGGHLRSGPAARRLPPALRRAVPRLPGPRLRHPALGDGPRGERGVRHRLGRRTRDVPGGRGRGHGRRSAHPRRRDARHRHRDPVQRRRVRRTDGAGRRTGPDRRRPGRPYAADLGRARGSGAPAKPWPGFLERFAPAYEAELDAFLRVARGESANPCDGREALHALRIAEACEVSRRERRPVAMTEIPGG